MSTSRTPWRTDLATMSDTNICSIQAWAGLSTAEVVFSPTTQAGPEKFRRGRLGGVWVPPSPRLHSPHDLEDLT
jgi:hypothetical protein